MDWGSLVERKIQEAMQAGEEMAVFRIPCSLRDTCGGAAEVRAEGADLDFLVGKSGPLVPRDNH